MGHPINHLSLCSGIGGIDLGLRAVVEGCRSVAYVEIEAFAVAHLVAAMEAGHLDSAPVFTNLHDFPWQDFTGIVDILSGGFPCQPFSHAGKRDGVEDHRHLWPTIARGIDIVRPRCVFFENVDGIASAKSPGYHGVLHHVISDLEGLGFRTTAGVFTAQEVGAPHLRKRWFILGVADADRDTCRPREPRRAGGELPEEGDGLRRGSGKGEAGEKSWGRSELGNADKCRCGQDITEIDTRQMPCKRSAGGPGGESGIGLDDIQNKPREQETTVWQMVDRSPFQHYGRGHDECVNGYCPRYDMCIEECDGCTPDDLKQRNEFIDDGESLQEWPARPGHPQHSWEPSRIIERNLGRNAYGVPHRVDRLRALGNAVVPAVAARAFATLWRELM